MAYGDRVSGVYVEFRKPDGFGHSVKEKRKSVDVIHTAKNRVLIIFKKAEPVSKSLTAKHIILTTLDGRDLVAEWREEVEKREPNISNIFAPEPEPVRRPEIYIFNDEDEDYV